LTPRAAIARCRSAPAKSRQTGHVRGGQLVRAHGQYLADLRVEALEVVDHGEDSRRVARVHGLHGRGVCARVEAVLVLDGHGNQRLVAAQRPADAEQRVALEKSDGREEEAHAADHRQRGDR